MTQSDKIADKIMTEAVVKDPPQPLKPGVKGQDITDAVEAKVAAVLGDLQDAVPTIIKLALAIHQPAVVMQWVKRGFEDQLDAHRANEQSQLETLTALLNEGKINQAEFHVRTNNTANKSRALQAVLSRL